MSGVRGGWRGSGGRRRRRCWGRREAADRRFDAVVVGEYERAFTARQFHRSPGCWTRPGCAVWLPEADGPVDPDDPTHRALMTVLAAQSQREVVAGAASDVGGDAAQTVEQGRFLGGRPPYGYRLVDAGPHPNRAHAAWGRRLQRLDPDPVTARACAVDVRAAAGRAQRRRHRAGVERAGCAVPVERGSGRNRHRTGAGWTLRSVAAILANPRYTGRQVWSRQRGRPGAGVRRSRRVGDLQGRAHPALVTEADFVAAQRVRASGPATDGATRSYLLAGLLRCGSAGGGWTRTGSTAGPDIGAAMATPAPGPARRTRPQPLRT